MGLISPTLSTSSSGLSPAHTLAILGDSISQQNGDAATIASPKAAPSSGAAVGYITWANMRLLNRLELVYNGGVGGETTAQILARVANVTGLSPKPGYCVVQGSTNDWAGSVPVATAYANMVATCNALIADGIVPILTTGVPNNVHPEKPGPLNRLLKQYARATAGVLLVDWYAYLADPTTGLWASGMSTDTVHPNSKGASFMGRALADTLSPYLPLADPLFASNIDAENLLTNGMFVGTGGTAGSSSGSLATGWTGRMGANCTFAKVARTDGIQGEWQQMTLVSTGTTTGDIYMAFSCAIGDVLVAEYEYELDTAGLDTVTDLALLVNNGGADQVVYNGPITTLVAGCSMPAHGVMRSAPTTMNVTSSYFFVKFSATAGVMRVGRASIRKLN